MGFPGGSFPSSSATSSALTTLCIPTTTQDGESASSSPATGFHPAKKFVPRADVAPPPPPKIGEMQTGNTVGGLTAAVELSTARSATGGDPSSNAAIPVIRLQIPSALGPKLAPVPCDCISGFCHEACACARLESCIPECACGGTCRAKKERIILTTTATVCPHRWFQESARLFA